METTVVHFSILEATRTLASVTRCCVDPRVSMTSCPGTAGLHHNCSDINTPYLHLLLYYLFQTCCTLTDPCSFSKWFVGITFSFFWKNHEAQSRFAITSGGKVISNGFSVYANSFGGYVEFYTRGNNQRWKVDINIPGMSTSDHLQKPIYKECIAVSLKKNIYFFFTVN